LAFNIHDLKTPEQFKRYAEPHIETAKKTFGFDFIYDMASVQKLD
jgi:hypothetical protein